MVAARSEAISKITQYVIPEGKSPEQYIHESIISLDESSIPQELIEYYKCLKSINAVLNKHDYIDSAIEKFENDESYTIAKIIELFSKNKEAYDTFTCQLREKLLTLNENYNS